MVSMRELMRKLDIGHTAYYRLLQRAGVKMVGGLLTDEDAEKLTDIKATMRKGKTSIYYRVVINEGYGLQVVAAGLSYNRAYALMKDYQHKGVNAMMRPCI